ncbi:MAG: PIN domain-containing protein [Gemmatimonadota bacterium]
MIVADTGAVIALIDSDDRHHEALLRAYERDPDAWILPWAILPEIDYLLATHVSVDAERAFLRDVAESRYAIEWGRPADLLRARQLNDRYRDLELGLVDAVVLAIAERHDAEAIATLDVRDFGAVKLQTSPALWPRDL